MKDFDNFLIFHFVIVSESPAQVSSQTRIRVLMTGLPPAKLQNAKEFWLVSLLPWEPHAKVALYSQLFAAYSNPHRLT